MNLSVSDSSPFSSHRAKRTLAGAVAALAVLGANSAIAQTWQYLPYSAATTGTQAGQAMAPSSITLNESSGKPVFRMNAGNKDTCYQGNLGAIPTRTETTTIIRVPPKFRGCPDARFVIKNDGTGGRREIKRGSEWVWDGLERGITPRK
jgi:hypothetical protein